MPEVWFTLKWPDGSRERCYSPSTIVTQHLSANTTYPLSDFSLRATTALQSASDRVAQIYGHPCSRAMGQLERINHQVAKFEQDSDPMVTCLSMSS